MSTLLYQWYSRSMSTLSAAEALQQTVHIDDINDDSTGPEAAQGDEEATAEFWRVGAKIAAALDLRTALPHLLINGRVSTIFLHRLR